MTRYADHFSTRVTPQSEAASPKQVRNNAGGYTFQLDLWSALDRWLILGADGGTYYASERKLTRDNAKTIQACLDADGPRTVARIAEISDAGRAPKNDPAIFALAMAAGHPDDATRKVALAALPKVCRTGTHLFTFVDAVRKFRGWGRGLRRAVSRWYTERSPHSLAYQAIKYQSRKIGKSTWTHRDVLRLAGGEIDKARSGEIDAVLRYIVAGMDEMGKRRAVLRGETTSVYPPLGEVCVRVESHLPSGDTDTVAVHRVLKHKSFVFCALEGIRKNDPEYTADMVYFNHALPHLVYGWELMKSASSAKEAAELITEYKLTHEMVLSQFKSSPEVWEALVPNMPATALIRNLATMTRAGYVVPFSAGTAAVIEKLHDAEWLKKARVHPLTIFLAMDTYARGRSKRGSAEWSSVQPVVDALEAAFYSAFDFVEPTGKNHMLALDCSGSMDCGAISGIDITPRVGAAIMAMATTRSEANTMMAGFGSSAGRGHWGHRDIAPLSISARSRLDNAVRTTRAFPWGGTDCALPMLYAMQHRLPIDHFVVYTDNETWAGDIHPHQALEQYRQKMGRDAKLSVVGMTATNFTIANPNDAGMLDVVGFDTATPRLLADFARGYGTD